MIASFVGIGINTPAETEQIQAFAETAVSEPSSQADLAFFAGQACETDHLVMTQGTASNYCDTNESGILVRGDQSTHDQAVAQAKAEADTKAAVEAPALAELETNAGTSAYYANCDAVRAAGTDPIYVGDPGYSRKLDREGAGVGCE